MVLCTVWDYEAQNYQITITFNTRTTKDNRTMGKVIKCKFWCNAGYTEEEVEIEIDETESEESHIEKEFHKWLDNNEDVGYEVL